MGDSILELAGDLKLICPEELSDAKAGSLGGQNEAFWFDRRKQWNRAVLKVDVNCTPVSALDELLKRLEGPSIPTFKLGNLPKSVQEDLYSIASPSFDTGPHCYNQWSTAVEAGPAKARFSGECLREPGQDSDHIDGLKGRTQSMPLPECVPEAPRAMLTDSAPSMPLPESSLIPDLFDLPAVSHEMTGAFEEGGWQKMDTNSGLLPGQSFVQAPSHSLGSADQGEPRGRQISCLQCGTMATPQWRSGPDGPRTMCNACGVKYRKELRDREKQGEKRKRQEC